MKIEEVPQDECFLNEGKIRDVYYAIDENGQYKQVLSLGWDPKIEALNTAWELIENRMEETRQAVLSGKLSPIAYYMEKNIMTPKLLAMYTRFWIWKVKRHLKGKNFNTIPQHDLEKYADVFGITIAELTDLERIKTPVTE